MANKKIVDLTALVANVDSNISEISDTAGTNPSMKITELQRKTYVNTDPTITGGSANGIVIGNTVPAAGFFNELVFTETGSHFSTNQVVDPIASLSKVFQMDVAGTTVSAQSVTDYASGFEFIILNSSPGDVTFIPDPPDLVNGAATLTIASNTAVTIVKNFSGITAWSVLSDNATSTGQPFLIANNLSESTNFPTLRNNIGATVNYQSVTFVGTTVLTNPCPTYINAVPSLGNDIVIQFPVMNSTTPGSKSLTVGQIVRVINNGSAGNVTLNYASTAPITAALQAGQFLDLTVTSNATSDGIFSLKLFKTGTLVDASDTSSTTKLAGALSPSSAFNGRLARYASDGNGSLTKDDLTNGQLYIGNTGTSPSLNTLTAGTGVTITNGAGTITINSAGGGVNYIQVDAAVPITMAPDTVYILNNSGSTIFTLPSSPTQGTTFGVIGISGSTGNFEIHQGDALQNIQWTSSATTPGVTGKIVSNDDFNCLTLTTTLSTGFDTLFTVTGNQGINYTFV